MPYLILPETENPKPFVIVNGDESAVMVFVNDILAAELKSHTSERFCVLSPVARLAAVRTNGDELLEWVDVTNIPTEKEGLLIYSVAGGDQIRFEHPPEYTELPGM